ncbi:unnamed protein product [Ceutorhynchus assimilis]|uniref:Uncharacterized protein n=1 Tax=Ceutorhynchus assimilis TaxID=467358 RepID=A0A9N9QR68_9CUCU|nr:unnamed protein product [Ceutorhynchus assimilis]
MEENQKESVFNTFLFRFLSLLQQRYVKYTIKAVVLGNSILIAIQTVFCLKDSAFMKYAPNLLICLYFLTMTLVILYAVPKMQLTISEMIKLPWDLNSIPYTSKSEILEKMKWGDIWFISNCSQVIVAELFLLSIKPNLYDAVALFVVIVFDGYDCKNTKKQEQNRRSRKSGSPDIEISGTGLARINQEQFFSNVKNKKAFIKMLVDNLRSKRINVIQSVGDADCDIVTKTVNASEKNGNVTLVCEDTDLLILLLHFSKKENVFMMRPGRQGTPNRITKIFDLQNKIKSILKNILLIHAAGGCDTVSGLYKIGKIKVLQLLEKLPELRNDVSIFYNPKAAKDDIIKYGGLLDSMYLLAIVTNKAQLLEDKTETYMKLQSIDET